MKNIRFATYKVAFHVLLHLPNAFYATLFTIAFPIYKALHTERAYGRVVSHLAEAHLDISARDVFRGIYWNALDSYRGLARFKSVENRIVYENEEVIRNAIAECAGNGAPIAAISIHQGAFELLHRSLCRYSKHVQLITDSVGDGAFREVLKELRSDPHLTEYHPDELPRLIRNLFKTKGILAMVIDQGRHTKGNTVTLFGRPSTLYLRLPQKVNRMGAGIVTFRSWTESSPERRIVIHFEKYYPPHYEEQDGNLPAEIASEVETWIKENPSQWSWNYHGNFKTED